MAKQKKTQEFKYKILAIRLALTAILAVAFLLIFFLCGGIAFISNNIGEVKCFASNEFEIHYIDVGQGDCTFIRFPDKKTMLIDAGPTSSKNKVCEYLDDLFKQESIDAIDYFLLTHQDSDHIGGASSVFENFQVNILYRPMVLSTYEVENFGNPQNYKTSSGVYYDNAIVAAYNEPNCSIRYSMADIGWGNNKYSVKFLSPSDNFYSNSNDYSPIVKIVYGEKSFLFTGDAESKAENEVIENYSQDLKADVLKVGHHGSKTSTSQEFLSYVQPKIAIISVGMKNSYGHPAEETIERLKAINCKIYQTSVIGDIALSVDSQGNIIMGGKNNAPMIDMTIVIAVFVVGVLIVWGVQPIKRKQKTSKNKENTHKS